MQTFVLLEALERLEHVFDDGPSVKLGKALNLAAPGKLVEGMAAPSVFRRFPALRDELEAGMNADTILMMLDLSPFSSVVSEWKPRDIAHFLNRYYRGVVEKIVEVNGVVEKYIGDAVLAAFGSPFDATTTADHLEEVIGLAMWLIEDIQARFEGRVTGKVALSYGHCFFGYVGHEAHRELTIVGTPLTELFRLEAECPPSSVILSRSLFDNVRVRFVVPPSVSRFRDVDVSWMYSEQVLNLRGVGEMDVSIIQQRGDS